MSCVICGANLISTVIRDGNGTIERICPTCQPDHPLSVAVWNEQARRDPLLSNKMTLEIYGRDLPATEVWTAVTRFVRDTFNADWTIDLIVDDEDHGEPS